MADAPAVNELLGADAPTNWGEWGPVVGGTGAPVNPIAIR
jgi:hypothetical protein